MKIKKDVNGEPMIEHECEDCKPQHTPTPWKQDGDFVRQSEPNGNLVAKVAGDTDQQACANAAFIVRAVNSHEELINAVKETLCLLDPNCNYDGANADDMPDNNRKEVILGLYAILAKAEGK